MRHGLRRWLPATNATHPHESNLSEDVETHELYHVSWRVPVSPQGTSKAPKKEHTLTWVEARCPTAFFPFHASDSSRNRLFTAILLICRSEVHPCDRRYHNRHTQRRLPGGRHLRRHKLLRGHQLWRLGALVSIVSGRHRSRHHIEKTHWRGRLSVPV